jgi:hypothetical protein
MKKHVAIVQYIRMWLLVARKIVVLRDTISLLLLNETIIKNTANFTTITFYQYCP